MSQRPGSSPAPGLACALNGSESCGTRVVERRQQLLDGLAGLPCGAYRRAPSLKRVAQALTGAPRPRLLLQIVKLRPIDIVSGRRVGVQPLGLGGHGKQKLDVLLRRERHAGGTFFEVVTPTTGMAAEPRRSTVVR